jgi:hypothetical protein
MKRMVVPAVLLLLLVAAQASAAPVVGITANTLPQGKFMMDTWVTWKSYDRYWQDAQWKEFPEAGSLTTLSMVPRVYYGVNDWFTLRGWLPFHLRDKSLPGDSSNGSNSGLGDIIIDPKVQLYNGTRTGTNTIRVALLTGVRFPTGDTDGTDGEGNLALSDGSYGFFLGGVLSGEMGAMEGHLAGGYWLNTENAQGYNTKDTYMACATLETDIGQGWSALWEFRYSAGEEGTDYYRTYACPGLCWTGEQWVIGGSAMVSMWSGGSESVSPVDFYVAPYFRIYYRFF